jgi:hypothetical protein
MGIDVHHLTIKGIEFTEYIDFEGAILLLPKGKEQKAYDSLRAQVKHLYEKKRKKKTAQAG